MKKVDVKSVNILWLETTQWKICRYKMGLQRGSEEVSGVMFDMSGSVNEEVEKGYREDKVRRAFN
jgi:hypothetical protein